MRAVIAIGSATLAVALCALAGPVLAADIQVEVRLKEHHFVPAQITAPADQRFALVIRNEDATPSEFESYDFHREKVIRAGDEAKVFVGPLRPGTYEFFDDFHPEARGRLAIK